MEYELKENEILDVRSDRLFHDLFNEQEMKTLEWTVMQILNLGYDEIHGRVRVGNIRLTNMAKNDKQKFVDLVVYLDDKIVVIELNNNYEGNYLRNVLYAMNVINNSYIEGGRYTDKKVQGILVNLNWYSKDPKYSKREVKYGYPIDGKEDNDYLLKIINFNLAYYVDKCYNEFRGVDKLSKLLTIKNKGELETFTNSENLLNDYYNKMNRLSKSKEYCKMIWDERIEKNLREAEAYYNGEQAGIRQGIQEGIEKGKRKSQIEMIKSFFQKGIDINTIAECSKLSVNEVKKIINI